MIKRVPLPLMRSSTTSLNWGCRTVLEKGTPIRLQTRLRSLRFVNNKTSAPSASASWLRWRRLCREERWLIRSRAPHGWMRAEKPWAEAAGQRGAVNEVLLKLQKRSEAARLAPMLPISAAMAGRPDLNRELWCQGVVRQTAQIWRGVIVISQPSRRAAVM